MYSANSGAERGAVTLGKYCPAFGSTPPNTLAVPQRCYSPSRRATRPGLMAKGGRTSWWSTTGFSSTQTTGSRSLRGFSYTAKMSSIRRMYSSSSSATHHIFFPPRLQVVAFQQNPNRFPSHSRNQFAFYHFFGQQAHRPARAAFRRWTTRQRHDALPVLCIQQGHFPRPWPLVQGPLQTALPIALAGQPYGLRG